MATVIAYIDGFNLYHGLRDRYGRRYLWLDLGHLVQRLRPSDHVIAVRYFSALVRDDPPARARQQTYLCPAIRTARSLNSQRGMIAAFPPRRSSFEIRSLIRGAFTVGAVDLRNSLLPDVVGDPGAGRVHRRPGKWR